MAGNATIFKKIACVCMAGLMLLAALAGCGAPAPAATTAAATAAAPAATTAAATTAAAEETTTTAAATAGATTTAATAAAAPPATSPPAPITEELPRVDMVYYIFSSEQEDSASVQTAMDEYFLEMLNCTVKIIPIPGGEWMTKVPLIYSAGEQVDLIADQSTRLYYTNVANGIYNPLNELVDKYCAEMLEQMNYNTPGLIDAPRVAGELYGIPCQKQTPQSEAWYFRTDVADAIGMNVDDLFTLQDLEPYLLKIQESYPEMVPYYVSAGTGVHMEWATDIIRDNPFKYEELTGAVNLLIVDLEQDKVLNRYETDWEFDRYEVLKKWQDLELINPHSSTTTTGGGDMFRAGRTWFVAGGGAPTTLSSAQISYGTPFYRWRSTPPIVNTYQNVTALTCIPRSSVDKERAMMAINLFHSDPYILNLFNFGIEGRHYFINADGRMELPAGMTARSETGYTYGFETFFGNMFMCNLWSHDNADRYDELREYNKTSKKSKIMGFYINLADVTTEYAAVEAIRVQYAPVLKGGVAPNVADTLKEMNDRMYANGLQVVIDEAQRQYDAFIAANGKG